MFDRQWFIKHQKTLLWFANSLLGRHILRINGSKIITILPQVIFRRGSKIREFRAEFRLNNWFARKIRSTFYPIWFLLHCWDILFANNFRPQWNLGFDVTTFNPNETGEGEIRSLDLTYATARDAVTGDSVSQTNHIVANDFNSGDSNFMVARSFFPFDTAVLGAGATITAATLEIYDRNSKNTGVDDTMQIVQSTQADNTNLVTGDFDAVGSTGGGTSAAYSALTINSYNTITLNATALTWISKTGYTPLALRATGDIDNTQPGARSYIEFDTEGNPAKLNVTYTARNPSYRAMRGVGV